MPLIDVTIYERFKEGIFAVSVLAGRQEAVHVANDGDSADFSGLADQGR
jgi:hypothetical protein